MLRRRREDSRRRLLDRLATTLAAAQRQRRSRAGWSGPPRGVGEPAWVQFERAVMHAEVNQARAEHGAAPVSMEAVARAEQLALGHIDYVAKFALHCSELVLSAVPEPSLTAAAGMRARDHRSG